MSASLAARFAPERVAASTSARSARGEALSSAAAHRLGVQEPDRRLPGSRGGGANFDKVRPHLDLSLLGPEDLDIIQSILGKIIQPLRGVATAQLFPEDSFCPEPKNLQGDVIERNEEAVLRITCDPESTDRDEGFGVESIVKLSIPGVYGNNDWDEKTLCFIEDEGQEIRFAGTVLLLLRGSPASWSRTSLDPADGSLRTIGGFEGGGVSVVV